MKLILLIIISITFSFSQFKNDRQSNIESKILAPCCYNGIILEHNSDISNLISSLISSLVNDKYNKDNILLKLEELLSVSKKQISLEGKKQLYNNIHQKMSDQNILKIFTLIYGEKIIAIPPNNSFGKITWFMPFIILLIAISVLSIAISQIRFKTKEYKIPLDEIEILENKINLYIKKMKL